MICILWLKMNPPLGAYDAAVVSVDDQCGLRRCSWAFTDYTMGIEPPRYPVPAPRELVWNANLDQGAWFLDCNTLEKF